MSFIFTQQRSSYSWEDGTGTILGSYGNLTNPGNIGTTSGISPYDGSRMLTVSESPIDGTPQAFIAWVTDLSSNQDITACFYGYDNTPSSAPSLRIWGSWSTNDDINARTIRVTMTLSGIPYKFRFFFQFIVLYF